MKYVFIVNPKAGDGKSEEVIRKLLENEPLKDLCEIHSTEYKGDDTDYCRKYLEEHKDEEVRFIACGGDGTINGVVNGIVGYDNASFTPFPNGSGNDFVKCFPNVDFNDIHSLLTAPVKKIDLMKVDDLYSVNVTNFGFDTTVAVTVNEGRDRRGHGEKSDYTKGIVKALLTAMKNKAKIIVDGEVINPEGQYLLCTLSNGQYVGGSFKCAPRSSMEDGLIEVCMIKCISRLRFVKVLNPYTNGEHLDDEFMKDIVVYRQAKKIEVFAPKGFAYSLDGEIIYTEHFVCEIAEKAINLAIPE